MLKNNQAKAYRYFVGIDCGVNTGYAVWDKKLKELLQVKSCMIHDALSAVSILNVGTEGSVFVRVEDARLRKWIPAGRNEKEERGRREGAGSVKRDSQIWEHFLKASNIDHEMVAPKNNSTKLKSDYFKKLTGWNEMTNEHGRDAAMLVYGK